MIYSRVSDFLSLVIHTAFTGTDSSSASSACWCAHVTVAPVCVCQTLLVEVCLEHRDVIHVHCVHVKSVLILPAISSDAGCAKSWWPWPTHVSSRWGGPRWARGATHPAAQKRASEPITTSAPHNIRVRAGRRGLPRGGGSSRNNSHVVSRLMLRSNPRSSPPFPRSHHCVRRWTPAQPCRQLLIPRPAHS